MWMIWRIVIIIIVVAFQQRTFLKEILYSKNRRTFIAFGSLVSSPIRIKIRMWRSPDFLHYHRCSRFVLVLRRFVGLNTFLSCLFSLAHSMISTSSIPKTCCLWTFVAITKFYCRLQPTHAFHVFYYMYIWRSSKSGRFTVWNNFLEIVLLKWKNAMKICDATIFEFDSARISSAVFASQC